MSAPPTATLLAEAPTATNIDHLVCRECGERVEVSPQHVCAFCFGPLEAAYDYERIAAQVSRETIASGPESIWRYAALLPEVGGARVDIGAGWTQLREA